MCRHPLLRILILGFLHCFIRFFFYAHISMAQPCSLISSLNLNPIQDALYLLHSECVLPKSDRGVLDNTLLLTPLDSDPPNPHPDSIYPHISLYLTTKTNMVLSPAFFYVCFIGLSLIPRFRRSVESDTHQSVIHLLALLIFRGRRIIHSFHLISLFYFQSPI